MMLKLLLILILTLTGCAIQPIPKPVPACEMTVAGKCKSMSASEISGATTLGNTLENHENKP